MINSRTKDQKHGFNDEYPSAQKIDLANLDITHALAFFDTLIAKANDSDNPIPGVLFCDDAINVMRFIAKNHPGDWANCRVRISKSKNVKISEIETLITANDDSSQRSNDSSSLISLVLEKCELASDDNNETFALINHEGTRQCWRLRSEFFKDWMLFEF